MRLFASGFFPVNRDLFHACDLSIESDIFKLANLMLANLPSVMYNNDRNHCALLECG